MAVNAVAPGKIVCRGNIQLNHHTNQPTELQKQRRTHEQKHSFQPVDSIITHVAAGLHCRTETLSEWFGQVATFRSRVHPDYFAEILQKMGELFNMAFVIVENNSHGILTCTRLGKDMAYPHFYTEVQIDKLTEKETVKLGFTTTSKTKPLIIDELRASVREGDIKLNDKTTIREMLTYVVTPTGSMEAEAGCYDDCVISLALCNHVHEGAWEPIPSTDEFYIEMV